MHWVRVMGVAIAAVSAAAQAPAQERGLTVELNKVEPGEAGGCRAFFLFRNRGAQALEEFEMSLAILDAGGVIDRLLTIDAAPLPAGRTTLKLFEIPEIGCGDISEVLLHDIPQCRTADGTEADCFAMLTLDSLADIRLGQ